MRSGLGWSGDGDRGHGYGYTMFTGTRKAPAYLLTPPYAYGKPHLCINIHHYAPPLTVLQQTAAVDAALHALRRQYTSEGSMSSFKSIA